MMMMMMATMRECSGCRQQWSVTAGCRLSTHSLTSSCLTSADWQRSTVAQERNIAETPTQRRLLHRPSPSQPDSIATREPSLEVAPATSAKFSLPWPRTSTFELIVRTQRHEPTQTQHTQHTQHTHTHTHTHTHWTDCSTWTTNMAGNEFQLWRISRPESCLK